MGASALGSLKTRLDALNTVRKMNPELELELMKILEQLEISISYVDFDLRFKFVGHSCKNK